MNIIDYYNTPKINKLEKNKVFIIYYYFIVGKLKNYTY